MTDDLPEMFPWQRETFQRKFDELTAFGFMPEEQARQAALTYALTADPIVIPPPEPARSYLELRFLIPL